jgi:alkylated DNA repair protein alkB family protein 1
MMEDEEINHEKGLEESNNFKEVFKSYKRRRPPPCLAGLLDPHNPDHGHHFPPLPVLQQPEEAEPLHCRPVSAWRAVGCARRPGLALLTGLLSREDEVWWADRCLQDWSSGPPARRNLDALSGGLAAGDWWRRCRGEPGLEDRLRWATLGYHHDWHTKEYSEEARGPVPQPLARLAGRAAAALGWPGYRAEAAIVNYYPTTASLSPHTDHSERDLARPLLSLSLGLAAVFLVGGSSLDEAPTALRLASGDLLLMAEGARLAYHAVPRVLAGSWATGLGEGRVGDYLARHRINVNIRQVNS